MCGIAFGCHCGKKKAAKLARPPTFPTFLKIGVRRVQRLLRSERMSRSPLMGKVRRSTSGDQSDLRIYQSIRAPRHYVAERPTIPRYRCLASAWSLTVRSSVAVLGKWRDPISSGAIGEWSGRISFAGLESPRADTDSFKD